MTPNTITVTLLGFAILVLLLIIRARGRANNRLGEKNDKLGAALHVSERKLGESNHALKQGGRKISDLESALKQAQQKITGLQAQISSRICDSAGHESSSEQRAKFLALPPDGREVFSPVLDRDRVYKITIEGTCLLLGRRIFFKGPAGYADGLYRTDKQGAFTDSHRWMYIDADPLTYLISDCKAKICEQDREAHRYSFQMVGTGKKVGIRFRPYQVDGAAPSNLTFAVEVLPETTTFPQKRISSKTNPSGNGAPKKKTLTASEYRERQRQLEAAKTEDELAQMESAFERQQKILERFEAQIESLQKKAGMSEENKKMLIAAFRAVLVETLKPPARKSDTSATPDGPKEPYVL